MAKIIQVAKKQLRRMLPYSPALWAKFGGVSRFLAHAVPTTSPAILVISMPRSGSSWLGDLLGIARNALYLREPISQSYAAYNKTVLFEVTVSTLPPIYRLAGNSAFAGLPTFPRFIVRYPNQWALSKRQRRRLVIKEVNPLALDWFIKDYRPKIIYLVRHPAAVANSVFALGWTGHVLKPEAIFSQQTLTSGNFCFARFIYSFWAAHGALQAIVLKRSLQLLEGYEDYRIVKYEDLCTSPMETSSCLYEFCGLDWDANIEREIGSRSRSSKSYQVGSYDLERNSAEMPTKWKSEVSTEHLAQLKEAYLSYNPPYYGPEAW